MEALLQDHAAAVIAGAALLLTLSGFVFGLRRGIARARRAREDRDRPS